MALCPPIITLDDGGFYTASDAQQWIWGNWLTFWHRVGVVRRQRKAALIQIYNGDLTEGDHHRTTQILSGNPTAQAAVVDACLKVPLALQPEHVFVIRGTEAHVGISASAEERIANGLHKDGRPVVPDPSTGAFSWWHAKLELNGVRLDCAHHGRSGQRPWTRPNIVNLLAFQIYTEHCLREERPPHLAIRSHLHRFADTGTTYPTRVIQTASFQLATAYVHKVAPESLADVGGLILVIDHDGTITVEPVLFRPDGPTVWRPAA